MVRGAALSGSSVFISMAAMLAVGKMFTNALDTEAVGVFVLLLFGADFLNLFSGLGLQVSLPKLVAAAPPGNRPRIIAAGLAFQALICLLLSALLYLVWGLAPGPRLFSTDPAWLSLWPFLWLLPPLFTVGVFREQIMAALAGLNRYGPRAAGIITSSLAQVAFVYLALWPLQGGLSHLAGATALSYALAVGLMFAALPGGAFPRFDWPAYRECLEFSWPLYVNQLLTFFYQRFDTVLVTSFLGVSAAAVYEMVKHLPTLLSRVMGAFLVPYLPNAAEMIVAGDASGAAQLLDRSVRVTAFAGYGATLGVLVVQEPLVRLLFNKEYLQGLPVLGLLLTATCLTVQTGLMGQTLIAMGRPRAVTLINIGLALIGVLGNLLLLPRFGLAGGGFAALAAIAFSGLLQTVYVRRYGLRVGWAGCLKPQVLMAPALALATWGGMAGRLSGLALFVTLSFAWSVIGFDELKRAAAALIPRNADKG
jgi:O-antigen/teichoic acid export membrane protein